MNGYITLRHEFLFPDQPLGELPGQLSASCARNGRVGVQLALECPAPGAEISVRTDKFDTELFQLIDVPVEYNTGDGVEQGGAMVILPDECPDYAIRKAPFSVFDCLRPVPGGLVPAKDGRCFAYLCLSPRDGLSPGRYELEMTVRAGQARHVCTLAITVYPVAFDENRFRQSNWFSIAEMERLHGVTRGTPAFGAVVRAYARSMRRAHQKVFLLWMHEDLSPRRAKCPYRFDFEDMKPIIDIFFEEGFDTLETGGILCRGRKPDGSPDMYTGDFKCAANPAVSADSAEGCELFCREMRAFSDFLARNGWTDRVLFHIIDEPDVHYKTEEDLLRRRMQFFLAANIARRYLPGVRIAEAVKTTQFRGGVDVMIPVTDGYQANKAEFDAAAAMGSELWTYVCCVPMGRWLNRFLDQPLLNVRLIFWGCALNRISGYLHWGYNQFAGVPNPFEATSARNWTGLGTNFPCGDAFIVYPGEGGPWLSMRLEAQREGVEEAALLSALREKDPQAHDALIRQVFTRFDRYTHDPDAVNRAHETLLRLLSASDN